MPILLPNHENFSLDDYNKYLGTLHLSKFWVKNSGAGTAVFSTAGMSFTGISTWTLDTFIPVNVSQGLFANFIHQQTAGAATVAISVDCYNEAKSFLGNRICFFGSAASPVASSAVRSFINSFGATATTFISGTQYAKVKIVISANTGTYTLNRPMFSYMTYAQQALYV